MKKVKDIKGLIFGEWSVLNRLDGGMAVCKCTCGIEKQVRIAHLNAGRSTSCGCQSIKKQFDSKKDKYGVGYQKMAADKRKKTLIDRYGVENPMDLSSSKEKIIKTNLERYGVDNALKISGVHELGVAASKSDASKSKRILTNIDRYGGNAPMCSISIQEKAKAVNVERYGVDNFSKTDIFKQLMQNDNPMFYDKNKEAFAESLFLKYGVRKLTDLPYFKDSIAKYRVGNESLFEYMKNITHINYDAVRKVYRDHGKDYAIEYIERYKTEGMTSPELGMSKIFSKMVPSIEKFDKKVLENAGYRPDFKLTDSHGNDVYINVDGLFPHSEICKDKNYHIDIRNAFEAEGKRIIQIYEDEIVNKPQAVLSFINNVLGLNHIRVGARECMIVPIEWSAASEALNNWHLMGAGSPARCIGLFYNDNLISVMTYKNKGKDTEIVRYASVPGTTSAGGFSRLVSYIEKQNPGRDIISFCDMRYSTAKSYISSGFIEIENKRSIIGFSWTDFKNRFNRLYCRANMDDRKLTEKQHAEELGLSKIYDAGQAKFIKKSKQII